MVRRALRAWLKNPAAIRALRDRPTPARGGPPRHRARPPGDRTRVDPRLADASSWSADLPAPHYGTWRGPSPRPDLRHRPDVAFRLVRCEVHLDAGSLRCYALRRRQPDQQPLLAEIPYALPRRRFYE